MLRKNQSVLPRYLASYMSVVLLACVSIGLLLLFFSTSEITQAEQDILRVRLESAATYLEQQFDLFSDIQVDIKTQLFYQPFYTARNAVYDQDLIDHFARYKGYSSLVNVYYLMYARRNIVYSDSSRYDFDIFARYLMNTDPDALAEALATSGPLRFVKLPARPDILLAVMPFHISSTANPDGACRLIFVLAPEDLFADIGRMSGLSPDGTLSMRYGDQVVLEATERADKLLSARSKEGRVTLSIAMPNSEAYARLASFRTYALLSIALLSLVFIFAAAVTAYRNYAPIKRLQQKLAAGGGSHPNELRQIEAVLSETLELNTLSQQRLDQQVERYNHQREWLRQQLLLMLLWGEHGPHLDARLAEVGITFPHALFTVLLVQCGDKAAAEAQRALLEEFTDEGIVLYAVSLRNERNLAAIVNTAGPMQLSETAEMYKEAAESRGYALEVRVGDLYPRLADLPQAMMAAIRSTPLADTADKDSPEKRWLDSSVLLLTAAIEGGQVNTAVDHLHGLLRQMRDDYHSVILCRYMMADLYHRLIRLSYRMGVETPEVPLGSLLKAEDAQAFAKTMEDLVRTLCGHSQDGAELAPEQARQVADYVEAHATDHDISLSSLAEHFDVSTKQINRLLKSQTGMTFKEYLVKLRMECAMRLLVADRLSISETAERVGYVSISHFIRTFKEYAGFTPNQFKTRNRD